MTIALYYYSVLPVGCLSVSVFVFGCPYAYHRNNASELHQICFLLIICRHGSVMRCDILCASGLVDDVIFAHYGRNRRRRKKNV